jgi:hypothetical protein
MAAVEPTGMGAFNKPQGEQAGDQAAEQAQGNQEPEPQREPAEPLHPPLAVTRFNPVYRHLMPDEIIIHDRIKAKAQELERLYSVLPGGRELSLALTKLEESVMWAIKAKTGC